MSIIIIMEYFGIQEIKSEKNQSQLDLHGETRTNYERIFHKKKIDRVRYNSFFEQIECHFMNIDMESLNQTTLCRIPTITIQRKLIDGAFRIVWLTISESLLHQVSWSVEGLNIFMFNHGLPQPLIQIIKVMEQKEIQTLSRKDLGKQDTITLKFGMPELGITESDCNIQYNDENIRSKLQVKSVTPLFSVLMQHPRLEKEKRREIKKIFKF